VGTELAHEATVPGPGTEGVASVMQAWQRIISVVALVGAVS
jgi:hypothetical protein